LAEWADGGETRWRERLLDTTALKVVAVRDGVSAGLVRGVVEDGCARLHSLWVSPQVRGQGLGNQLVAAVEEWAARQDATYIRLEVVPDNAPAIALHRRHGYVDTGVLGELLPDGDRELAMEKSCRAVGPIGATLRNSRLINSRPCQFGGGASQSASVRIEPRALRSSGKCFDIIVAA
jgi:hypothetical protein